MPHYDLVIVGTGSGNSIVNHEFADWNVAIVEHARFGGTCLNVGCIPTKMYVHPADLASEPEHAARLGVDLDLRGVRWTDVRDRIFGRIDAIEDGGRDYRKRNPNVTVYEATARFTGPKRLWVSSKPKECGEPRETSEPPETSEEITADRIVIAAGSRPEVPDIPGLAGTVDVPGSGHHTSDTVMRIEHPPPRMVILGGGFIAAEMAHVFSSFGTQVTVITRGSALLRDEDADVSTRFTELARDRWDVRTGRRIASATRGHGVTRLELTDSAGPANPAGPADPAGSAGSAGSEQGDGETIEAEVVEAEIVLVAVGRRPNTDVLDAERGGLRVMPDGRLEADATQRTSVPGVWALGDICSADQLKHVANYQARLVRHNLLHTDAPASDDGRAVAHAVFTSPQVAAVGLTEREAQQRGLAYVTAIQQYGDIAFGWAMEDTTGFCKVLADPESGRILGGHIIGPQASSLIQPLVQAMAFGQHAYEVARAQYWIHPSLPELVENALLGLGLKDTAP